MRLKRIAAAFLAVVMLLSIFPLTVFAGDDSVNVTFDKESYEVGDPVKVSLAVSG